MAPLQSQDNALVSMPMFVWMAVLMFSGRFLVWSDCQLVVWQLDILQSILEDAHLACF